jgi:Ser/Thr protein kinase RdoA (MazF antagonist)
MIFTTNSATCARRSTSPRGTSATWRAPWRPIRHHRLHAVAAALAEEIFEAAAILAPLPITPVRVVHGDPKISNLVFAPDADRALCMLDLDTLGTMALPFELGDALRSWCNVASEDDPRGSFSAALVRGGRGAATGRRPAAGCGLRKPHRSSPPPQPSRWSSQPVFAPTS